MASHILANEGVCDAYGHISVRHPEAPNRFLISRAQAPDLITEDDMVEMDFENHILEAKEGYRPFSESVIHAAIYAARDDVNCVCHAHPLEVIPFASSDIPLRSMTHLGVVFYEGIPVFQDLPPEAGLLVNTMEMGRALARTLGHRRGALIRNHGMVVVGESIPRGVYAAITMRDCALVQQQTLSMGGKPRFVGDEEAEKGAYIELCGQGLTRAWDYWTRRATLAYPELSV